MYSNIFESFMPIQFVCGIFWTTAEVMKIFNVTREVLIFDQIVGKGRFSNSKRLILKTQGMNRLASKVYQTDPELPLIIIEAGWWKRPLLSIISPEKYRILMLLQEWISGRISD